MTAPRAAETWRLVLAAGESLAPLDEAGAPLPARGALNMAVDQALFEGVQQGDAPVLRFYRWQPACLSFGRHQLACGHYDPEAARARGIDIVRRPTGGLAVLHAAELTYAVIAPVRPLGGPRAAYARINQALMAGLRAVGVPAAIATATHAPSPDSLHPCFQQPAPGELVALGRKLVGSAQRVERHTLLQHGSILLDGDQGDVVRLQPGALPGPRGEITVAELLPALPAWPELLAALRAAFESTFGVSLIPAALDDATRARVAEELERFSGSSWTWRR